MIAIGKRRRADHRERRSRHAGFTLLEAVLAASLLSVSAMMLTVADESHRRHHEIAVHRTLATQSAQSRLEQLRLQWTTMASAPAPSPSITGADAPVVRGGAVLSRRWSIVPVTDASPERIVTVTVEWDDRGGRPHDVALTTVLLPLDVAALATLTLPRPALAFFGVGSP